jgi:hypothetical protein
MADGEVYREAIRNAPALLLDRSGKRELLLSKEVISAAFPNPRLLLRDPAVKAIMRHDQNRNTIKVRVMRGGKLQRFHCFGVDAEDS